MGGTSVPMLFARIAAIRRKSVGTEVPPTTAGSVYRAATTSSVLSLRDGHSIATIVTAPSNQL
ncbi:DUF6053 domain-containing protein [Lysobacter enzymogenes]|uniref:DUF6053 domain-containing protein n=1 Tax=Lysobacter enzymogenes TaxID=69 RepID=UPI003D18B6A4